MTRTNTRNPQPSSSTPPRSPNFSRPNRAPPNRLDCVGFIVGCVGLHFASAFEVALISTGIGVLMVMIWCFRKKLSSNKKFLFLEAGSLTNQTVEAFIRNFGPFSIRRYSYSKIKKMTNFFTDKVGQGGYGGVYKGKLPDGSLVAVKVLKESRGTGEEFISEVASISRTSHVNIVTLMTFFGVAVK